MIYCEMAPDRNAAVENTFYVYTFFFAHFSFKVKLLWYRRLFLFSQDFNLKFAFALLLCKFNLYITWCLVDCCRYMPLTSLILFMIGFSLGFGCIPFLLLGELFATKQRGALSALAGSFNLFVMFVVIKTYHSFQVNMKCFILSEIKNKK